MCSSDFFSPTASIVFDFSGSPLIFIGWHIQWMSGAPFVMWKKKIPLGFTNARKKERRNAEKRDETLQPSFRTHCLSFLYLPFSPGVLLSSFSSSFTAHIQRLFNSTKIFALALAFALHSHLFALPRFIFRFFGLHILLFICHNLLLLPCHIEFVFLWRC